MKMRVLSIGNTLLTDEGIGIHVLQAWDPSTWPSHMKGVGRMIVPRGGLSHWIVIDDARISHYQAVVPSTWSADPRDAQGQPGAYKAALHDRIRNSRSRSCAPSIPSTHASPAPSSDRSGRRGTGAGEDQVMPTTEAGEHAMTPIKPPRWILSVSLVLFAGTAAAHTGDHAVQDFAGGLAHPFLGLDHLLAMIAVGLWAAQQGGRAVWTVPAAFVGAMLAGGGLAAAGIVLPLAETGIALSVLALGLLIATRRAWAVPAGMLIAAGFALFHGYAHGLKMPLAVSPMPYMLGFVLATGCLHGAGIIASLIGRRAIQWAGAGIATAGLALLFSV